MKFFKQQLEKARPLFAKGGKLEKLYPIFEAQESFMFVLAHRTDKGAHIRDPLDTKRLMSMVILALVPPLLFGMYNIGYQYYSALGPAGLAQAGIVSCFLLGLAQMLPIIIVSYAAGGVWELLFSVIRKHEINEGFLVTGMLVPMIVPPTIPLWQVAVGVSFGVVIGKEVFGGTGMNVFNPALVARAFLFFSYPAQISGDKVWALKPDSLNFLARLIARPEAAQVVDGYSGATPLSVAASVDPASGMSVVQAMADFGHHAGSTFADYSFLNMLIGRIPGSIGETSTLMCLIGAAILIGCGVGSWRIMVACVAGLLVTGGLLNLAAPNASSFLALPAYYHLVMGGFAFGAVYMATDPVSASHTNTGKWVYGFLIGFLCVLIRTVNPAYPEGMMLAILFMNAFSPLIDYFVVKRHIGRRLAYARA